MANYHKKRRYSGCYMCKRHKRFPGITKFEARPQVLKQKEKVKDELKHD